MVVHRLLAAALRLAPLPDAVRERGALHALADNLNARHRGAQACAQLAPAYTNSHNFDLFESIKGTPAAPRCWL